MKVRTWLELRSCSAAALLSGSRCPPCGSAARPQELCYKSGHLAHAPPKLQDIHLLAENKTLKDQECTSTARAQEDSRTLCLRLPIRGSRPTRLVSAVMGRAASSDVRGHQAEVVAFRQAH